MERSRFEWDTVRITSSQNIQLGCGVPWQMLHVPKVCMSSTADWSNSWKKSLSSDTKFECATSDSEPPWYSVWLMLGEYSGKYHNNCTIPCISIVGGCWKHAVGARQIFHLYQYGYIMFFLICSATPPLNLPMISFLPNLFHTWGHGG